MDFEALLKAVGHYGRYQKCILLLFGLMVLLNATHLYIQVFTAGKSDHWCQSWVNEDCPTDLDDADFNCEVFKKALSTPMVDNDTSYEQCTKYNVSGIDLQTAIDLGDDVTKLNVIPCDEGWEYDRSTFPSTIIQDFELVCGKSYLPNIAQSTYFAGFLVGSALAGLAADSLGRRFSLLLNIACSVAVGIFTMFSPNTAIFITLRFFMAVFLKSIGQINFVAMTEVVAPSKRVFVANFMWMFFAGGYFFLSGMAKLIGNWRLLTLIFTLPYIPLFVITFFFLQESPRWLITRRDTAKAQKVLSRIASVNQRDIQDEEIQKSCDVDALETTKTNEAVGNLAALIRSPTIVLIVVNMCFNWAVQSLVFYGLSLSTSSLGIDPYISFIISGAIEIPAYFSCIFVAEWLGRKGATFTTMILGGLCCCITPLIPIGIPRALVAMGGKFFITMSFSIVSTWSAELIPTPLRSSGIGLFSLTSRIGGILAPLILLLDQVWTSLPVLVFGSFSITAGLLCLLMPETKGQPLPASVDDTKSLYKKTHQADNDDAENYKDNYKPSDVSEKPALA
ncbi:solute carrier family 22 member 13-like [Apostichopus japonicus]|uniref:solute carrier family 22 member 13-like n=1 Tax=Stichopus japonicus TaxID=307972 RepID=UPI003AB47697